MYISKYRCTCSIRVCTFEIRCMTVSLTSMHSCAILAQGLCVLYKMHRRLLLAATLEIQSLCQQAAEQAPQVPSLSGQRATTAKDCFGGLAHDDTRQPFSLPLPHPFPSYLKKYPPPPKKKEKNVYTY